MSDTPETDVFSNNRFHDRAHELTELYNFTMGLERERDEARAQLYRICKEGFGNDDTIGLEPGDDYILRQLAKMRDAIKLYMQIIGSPDVQPSEHWSDDDDLAQAWDKGQEALKGEQP
jgi:hypothetical protein